MEAKLQEVSSKKAYSPQGLVELILLYSAFKLPSSPAGQVCHALNVSENWGAGSAQSQMDLLKVSHIVFTFTSLFKAESLRPVKVIVESSLHKLSTFFINSSENLIELLLFCPETVS